MLAWVPMVWGPGSVTNSTIRALTADRRAGRARQLLRFNEPDAGAVHGAWGEPMLHAPTDALAAGYIKRVFAMLDALPFVERYAWFTDDCWSDVACR